LSADRDEAWIRNGGFAEREASVVRRLLDAGGECLAYPLWPQHRGPGWIVGGIEEGVVSAMAFGTGYGVWSKSFDRITE
jgi:hypothetical protein